jgi:hypothetical protein
LHEFYEPWPPLRIASKIFSRVTLMENHPGTPERRLWGLFAAFVSLIVVAVGLFLYLSSGVDRAKSATNLSPTVMGTPAPPALPAPVPDLVVPNEVAWKAPAVSPGVDTAVICGDPSKPGASCGQGFPSASNSCRTFIRTNVVLR